MNPITLEDFLKRYLGAPDGIKQEALQAGFSALQQQSDPADNQDAELHTLVEIALVVRKHPTWLHRLKIQQHAGERIGGRYMYRKHRVLAYLQSEECLARIAEIRAMKALRKK
jgi:hypothetical protein